MHSFTILLGIYVIVFIAPSNPRMIDDSNNLATDGDVTSGNDDEVMKTVTYIRASTPTRILECIRRFSILRCTKLFVLQKMEARQINPRSGNLTKDFLDQFFGNDDGTMTSLVDGELSQLSDSELTRRVIWHFERFFENQNIQLHFLPGIMVKIVPSKENKIKFSLKKSKRRFIQDLITGRSKRGQKKKEKKKKHSYKDTMIQMAVPVMVMPAVLLGTFLPFILPALKMATIMSTIMNNSAFLAALLYAARTHVMNSDNDAQQVSYPSYHGGYH